MQLAKEDICSDLTDHTAAKDSESDFELQIRREAVAAKLRRLKPGGSTALRAIQTERGAITSCPDEIADSQTALAGDAFATTLVDAAPSRPLDDATARHPAAAPAAAADDQAFQ